MRSLCPCCRREVRPVRGHDLIETHLDTINRDECPSSREPFYTTVVADPEMFLRRHQRRGRAA